jgi:hypothetical protein
VLVLCARESRTWSCRRDHVDMRTCLQGLLRVFAQLPAAERRSQLLGDVKTRGRPAHVGLTDQQVRGGGAGWS